MENNSKVTICRHMVKNIGDLVPDKRKQYQGRPTKAFGQTKAEHFTKS